MSEENFEDGNESEGIKSLRAAKAKQDKELAELREQLGAFQKSQRQNDVKAVLKAKGVPESAAALYSGDDTSETAVSDWLNQYADVFNVQTATNNANESEVQRQANALAADAERLFSPRESSDKRIMGNPEEILANLNNLPYEELVKLGYMPEDRNNRRRPL